MQFWIILTFIFMLVRYMCASLCVHVISDFFLEKNTRTTKQQQYSMDIPFRFVEQSLEQKYHVLLAFSPAAYWFSRHFRFFIVMLNCIYSNECSLTSR